MILIAKSLPQPALIPNARLFTVGIKLGACLIVQVQQKCNTKKMLHSLSLINKMFPRCDINNSHGEKEKVHSESKLVFKNQD